MNACLHEVICKKQLGQTQWTKQRTKSKFFCLASIKMSDIQRWYFMHEWNFLFLQSESWQQMDLKTISAKIKRC